MDQLNDIMFGHVSIYSFPGGKTSFKSELNRIASELDIRNIDVLIEPQKLIISKIYENKKILKKLKSFHSDGEIRGSFESWLLLIIFLIVVDILKKEYYVRKTLSIQKELKEKNLDPEIYIKIYGILRDEGIINEALKLINKIFKKGT